MNRGLVAICETEQQAEAVSSAYPDATIVALSPVVDAWRERKGRSDRTIEDLFDDRAVNLMGTQTIERVEAIVAEVDRLFGKRVSGQDGSGHLSFGCFFHYLNSILDSFVLRAEQITAVLHQLKPARVLAFKVPFPQFCGLTSLDRPPWGLASSVLPGYAQLAGIPIEYLNVPLADPSLYNPLRDQKVRALRQPPGRARMRVDRVLMTMAVTARRMFGGDAPYALVAEAPGKDAPILIALLFADVVGEVLKSWEIKGGQVLSLHGALPARSNSRLLRCRLLGQRLYQAVESDEKIRELLTWRGFSMWPWLRSWFYHVCVVRYPELLEWAKRLSQVLLIERRYKNAVILAGGWVDEHHVLARVAHAAGIPTVSYHYGGYLGYSLLPKHERYDLAECDYFIVGGDGAEETFAEPAIQTRWNKAVKRARPVPTGVGWADTRRARTRTQSPMVRAPRRVMVVLNAPVGDCRDLGYVFYPEIAYWRFKRRVIDRISQEQNVSILIKLPLKTRYPQMPSPLVRWLAENPRPNITFAPDVPFADCIDQADIVVLESPSTSLIIAAATEKRILAYIDRSLYLFQDRAWDALGRRASILADSEEAFMSRLDAFLNSGENHDLKPDHTFLRDYVVGGESGTATERICDFLLSLAVKTPRAAND